MKLILVSLVGAALAWKFANDDDGGCNGLDNDESLCAHHAVTLSPAYGQPTSEEDVVSHWTVHVTGSVVVVDDDCREGWFCGLLARLLAFMLGSGDDERVRAMLGFYYRGGVGGKAVHVQLMHDDVVNVTLHEWSGGVTAADGSFEGTLRFATDTVDAGDVVRIGTDPDRGDKNGEVLLLNYRGVSIISAIDDTLRVTGTETVQMINYTLARPFRSVKGMAALYRRWAHEANHFTHVLRGLGFHYISGAPQSLESPLRSWMGDDEQDGGAFPFGSYHLTRHTDRDVDDGDAVSRLRPRFARSLHAPPQFKLDWVTRIMERWRDRRFVLLGNSFELDPEIFGHIARTYPKRVLCVLIREVPGYPMDAERSANAFKGVRGNKHRVISKARDLRDVTMVSMTSFANCGKVWDNTN